MRQILFGDKVYQISDRDFLNRIIQLIKGYGVLAKLYDNYHGSGFADVTGTFEMPDIGQKEMESAFTSQIDDEQLADSYHLLLEDIRKMKELDSKIVNWLAKSIGMSPPQSIKEKARLKQRINILSSRSRHGQGPSGPFWVMEPEYQMYIKTSHEIMLAIVNDQNLIFQRIQQIQNDT